MRAPPEAVKITTGRRSSVARSTSRHSFSPTTEPMEPMKNCDSMMPTATRKPAMRPSPVRTASSSPVLARCAASLPP